MKKSRKNEAHIEHVRYEVFPPFNGIDPALVRSVTVEHRGLEDFVRRNYHDEMITAAEAMFNQTDNIDILSDLIRHADSTLKKSNADGWDDVISKVDSILEGSSDESEKTRNAVIDAVVSIWLRGISQKHGHLSREYKCANLLYSSNLMMRIAGENEAVLQSVSRLCEAYYWAQLDLTAMHYLAVEGRKARAGRAASPIARRQAGKKGEGILRAVLTAYIDGLKGADIPITKVVAASIQLEVNRLREKEGLKPLTDNSLQQMLKAPLTAERKKKK